MKDQKAKSVDLGLKKLDPTANLEGKGKFNERRKRKRLRREKKKRIPKKWVKICCGKDYFSSSTSTASLLPKVGSHQKLNFISLFIYFFFMFILEGTKLKLFFC